MAMMVTGVLAAAGCSGGGSDDAEGADAALSSGRSVGAMATFAADTQFTATQPMDLSILWTDWPELPVKDSWRLLDEIKKRTNVTLKLTHMPLSDAAQKRGLLISAGDAPTLIPLIYTGDETPLVSSGAVLPISDYVRYMPNFQKYTKQWNLEKMVDNLKKDDGKYYMVPGLQEVSVPAFTLIIRKDIFDQVGAPVPQNWDQLRDALRLIKSKYPDSKPLADGFAGSSMLNYASHAWGTRAGWGFGDGMILNKSTGKLEYAGVSDDYKSMVEFFHGLVKEGLLDTESFVASSNDSAGMTVKEKMAKSKVFAASGSNATVAEFATVLDETVGAGKYKLLEIAPPGGVAGQVVEPRNFWNGFLLNSKVKDSPNFLATLQFLDWLYYNPDAREMLRWGIKDETYTKSSDGKIKLNSKYSLDAFGINPDGAIDLQKDLGFATPVLADSTESRALKESYNSPDFVEYINSVLSTRTPRDPYPNTPLDESELEQSSLLATPLKDTVDTNTLKFILGQRDLSEWDKYVAEIKGRNLQAYVEQMNGALQRAQAKS
jgi:putative aldouronate transport system substrate-binding protein